MHGPTFMANPLACAIAVESLRMLNEQDMAARLQHIERKLREGLEPARALPNVADVRCIGSIGVIELTHAVDQGEFQARCVDAGVWVRPFGRNAYLMPPYIITDAQLDHLTSALVELVKHTPEP